ncbi:DnaJ domain-containing protein [Fomes fomentarius]|nr:DnaJ domain-containing protein [Fomes fomentarius]
MGAAQSTTNVGEDYTQFESDDWYVVLGIGEDASGAAIKAAYRRLALVHHPDKNIDDAEGATRRFAAVQQAYEGTYQAVTCNRPWFYMNRRPRFQRRVSPEQKYSLRDFQAWTEHWL